MEPVAKRSTDWLFIIGLVFLILGYLFLMLWIYGMFIGAPIYLIGAALIGFSRKSRKVKLWIILPTLLLNTTTIMYGIVILSSVFE
jgi:hypothetical protein